MADIGYIALFLALVASIYSAIAFILGSKGGHPALIHSARNGLLAVCGLVSLSVAVLLYALLTHNFQIEYVASYTSRDLPYPEERSLLVKEYSIFVNDSDRAYVGSKEIAGGGAKETLAFILPEKATDLQPITGLMECCMYGGGRGFVDTMPVLPGGREIAYSYRINNVSGEFTFHREINYPTTKYDLLVRGGDVQVLSGRVMQQETVEINGARFNHFEASDFPRGDVLAVQLSGLSGASSQMALTWVAIALAALIFGFSAAYILRKRKLQPVRAESSKQMRQNSLVGLARLDDEFDSGKISEDDYRKSRAEKKAQLVSLMQRQGKSSDHK